MITIEPQIKMSCTAPGAFILFTDAKDKRYIQYRSKVSWQSRLETWFLILKVFENRVSRLEFRISIFEDRESSFEARVSNFDFRGSRVEVRGSSFETLEEFFEDLEQRFRENNLIPENKTIAMNKTIDAQLY